MNKKLGEVIILKISESALDLRRTLNDIMNFIVFDIIWPVIITCP